VDRTAPAILELGLLLLLAALAGRGLISNQVNAALVAAVVLTIAPSSILVPGRPSTE